jgi:uncharacterized protein (TIGR00730 family)
MKSLLVYCGSNPGSNPVYKETAIALGKELVARNISLIYSGGSLGLMGTIANTEMENGGEVIGIIPSFLDKIEVGHPNLTEIHVVESMHERKALMEQMCDSIIKLPGGYGGMDELFEILSWSQLGLHNKPVGLLNVNGFYVPLVAQLDLMVREGFLKRPNKEIIKVSDSVAEVFELMEDFVPHKTQKWLERDSI